MSNDLYDRAYEAADQGRLGDAVALFSELLAQDPDEGSFHYMRGLAHKYRREWAESLRDNLRAQALAGEPDEAAAWNAGIAATGLGDWAEARRQWALAGITLPEGEGPVEGSFGVASIRLNAWGDGETLYARRVDPCRARLINIPLPESGYRFGDVVLHDGASTGRRKWGGSVVPVFNAMQRVQVSEWATWSVFATCATPEDRDALVQACLPGIGCIEDWTESMRHYCLRCSYGLPHEHGDGSDQPGEGEWSTARDIGIAAQARASVDRLLSEWRAGGAGRSVQGVESRAYPLSVPEEGQVWWQSPQED